MIMAFNTLYISLISDGLIALLLIASIAYTVRLTIYLRNFKKSRTELETIVRQLSMHIDTADRAVQTLHNTVDECSEDLDRKMHRASRMFDELDLIVQSGDSLANRLEEVATRNRTIIDGGDGDVSDLSKMADTINPLNASDDDASSPFSIRDPEIEKGGIAASAGFTLDNNDVLSEAERDLYETLQKAKTSKEKAS